MPQNIPVLSEADKIRIIALGIGAAQAQSGFEKHFVKVLRDGAKPHSLAEKAWLNYWTTHENANSLSMRPPGVEPQHRKERVGRGSHSEEGSEVAQTRASTLSDVTFSTDHSPTNEKSRQRYAKGAKASAEKRYRKLRDDLAHALRNSNPADIEAWAIATANIFRVSAFRRASTFVNGVSKVGKGALREVVGVVEALASGRGKNYFIAVGDRAAMTSAEIGSSAKTTFGRLSNFVKEDPTKGAMAVFGAALGFLAGSGGIDANGGACDLDIPLLGIGAHRSIFTHSILIGITIETAVMSFIDLNRRIHRKLPNDRDPFWDNLLGSTEQIADAFSRGASSGVAYHLFVDATVQPGPYHDLEVAIPLEAHQAILMMNSIAEGLDAATREGVAYKAKTAGGEAVERAIRTVEEIHKTVGNSAANMLEFCRDRWGKT